MSALERLETQQIGIFDHSNVIDSLAMGPSSRNYANSAAIIATKLSPEQLLYNLKLIEHEYGKRRGQRWSERCLDLDIILWSNGVWSSRKPALFIPHPQYHFRSFVLEPASQIAGDWRDPISKLTINQILFRHRASKRVDRSLRYL